MSSPSHICTNCGSLWEETFCVEQGDGSCENTSCQVTLLPHCYGNDDCDSFDLANCPVYAQCGAEHLLRITNQGRK